MTALPTCVDHVPAWRVRPMNELAVLVRELPLTRHKLRVYGRELESPRMICSMGDASYTYSGQTHPPAPWHPLVDAIRRDAEAATGAQFNACVANYYRDGSDSIEWHSDDEPELGDDPTIASVTFGAVRAFAMRRIDRAGDRLLIPLGPGDLLVMRGECQRTYHHSVPKMRGVRGAEVGPRLNLTFRYLHDLQGR